MISLRVHSLLLLLLLLLLCPALSLVHPSGDDEVHRNIDNSNGGRNLGPHNVFARPGEFETKSAEQIFEEDCSRYLLSESVLEDQKISSSDFVGFLVLKCLEQQTCGVGDAISFDSLNNHLRTTFLLTACPIGSEDSAACYYDWERTEAEFGMVANPDTLAIVDERVASLCSTTFSIINEEGMFEPADETVGSEEEGNITPPSSTEPQPTENPKPLASPTPEPTKPPQPSPTENPKPLDPPTAQQPTEEKPTPLDPPTPAPIKEWQDSATTSPPTPGSPSNPELTIARNVTDFTIAEDGGPGLTTAAILGIISAVAALAFCIAVMYSGGFKEPEYDMNKRDLHPLKHDQEGGGYTDHSGADVFEDEATGDAYDDYTTIIN
jgi:hypothetical protein